MKNVGILNTCAVVIAMFSFVGCADPEPEVARNSDSASSSERESKTSREPVSPENRPAIVNDRDDRDMKGFDGERANSDSPRLGPRSSESRGSRPAGPGLGDGPLPGIRPLGGDDSRGVTEGIGMPAPGTASRNPNAGRQPEANRQPEPREYKLEFVAATGTKGLEVGDTIPEVDGKDLDNIKFKLSDYKGKVVMLDFWGDW
jgi:hypothetical protein